MTSNSKWKLIPNGKRIAILCGVMLCSYFIAWGKECFKMKYQTNPNYKENDWKTASLRQKYLFIKRDHEMKLRY